MENDTLSLYKPQVSVTQAFEVDESQPDNELCYDLFKKLIYARKTQDLVYLSIGKMLKIFRDRKLYKTLDFEDFSQFLASEELSFSREKAYMLIRVYEHYSEFLQLGEDVMRDFPINRLSLMIPLLKKMPEKADQIKELERIKSLRHNDFIRDIKSTINIDGRPNVFWSEESNHWIVQYHENITHLIPLGDFIKKEEEVISG